jgi:general secretion pathway protein B
MQTVLLPTIHELRADGRLALPDLHVDIHVYSEAPKDRFVFINMTKHNEGSRLAEGPVVEEITTDGVVLNQNGTLFLVPRD